MHRTIALFFILWLTTGLSVINAQQEFEIFVSDARGGNSPTYAIFRFDADGSNGRLFTDQQLNWPQDILFLEDQEEVLVSSLSSGRITKYNPATGAYLGNFAAGLSGPTRMELRNDTIYVLQWLGSGRIERFLTDGTQLTAFSTRGVPLGIGIAWDEQDRMYVSAYGRQPFNGNPAVPPRVYRYDKEGNYLGVFIDESQLNGPTNIWFDPEGTGDLFLIDYNAGNVKRFSAEGTPKGTFITGLQQPEGVARLDNGDYLIGDGGSGKIKRFTATGQFVEDMINGNAVGLRTPNALRFRSLGAVSNVDEIAWDKDWKVYPTAGRRFFLETEIVEPKLLIHDAKGRLVEKVIDATGMFWCADNLPAGTYWVTLVRTDGRQNSRKVLVGDQ